jgi:hypothetical protein
MPVEPILVFLLYFAGKGLPLGTPPGPEDPAIARMAPERCLFYMSWAGAAEPDPKSRNQTEQLLAEPEVRQLMRSLEPWARSALGHGRASYTAVPRAQSPEPKARSAEETVSADEQAAIDLGIDFLREFLTRPTAIFVEDVKFADGKPAGSGGIVVSLRAGAEKLKAAAEKVLKKEKTIQQVQIEGQTWFRSTTHRQGHVGGQTWTIGFQGSYFIAATGEKELPAILARMKQKEPPAWLTAIAKQVPIQRRTVVTYINLKSLRELLLAQTPGSEIRTVAANLGLDKVTSLVQAAGLEGEGFVCRTLLATEGQPSGLLRLVSDRPLRPEDLKPIPRDATFALALRFDLAEAVDTIVSAVEKANPDARGEVEGQFDRIDRRLGLGLRKTALRSLGDTWCIYNSPGEGGWLTVVVPIRNPATFLLAYGKALDAIREMFPPLVAPSVAIRSFPFADRTVYWFPGGAIATQYLAPAWCVNGHELVLSLTPQNIKAYLARGDDYQSLAAAPEVARQFSAASSPAMLGYLDTPRIFELFYPFAPMVVEALRQERQDLDTSLLPSAPAIRRHLRPEMAVLRRTPAGIEQTTYECLPEAGIGVTVAAGLVLASGAIDSENPPPPGVAAPAPAWSSTMPGPAGSQGSPPAAWTAPAPGYRSTPAPPTAPPASSSSPLAPPVLGPPAAPAPKPVRP